VRTWPDGDILGEHTAKVVELATSDTHVASASWDARIGLWTKDGQGAYLSGHRQGVNSVAFSGDGKTLYSASVDGTIRIWDVETAQEKQLLAKHGFGINKLILNEEAGWLAYGASDGGTRIIDAVTAEQIADFTLDRRPILSLAFDPKAGNLAVGDGHGFIMVIDTNEMKITRDFRAAAQGPIWALAFSPDGQNIHAGGIEDIMYSWPIATMDEHGQMSQATRSFLEDPETLPNGERQFKRKCSICHTVTKGSARKAGPSLHRLFGRRAGTVSDYAYSDILEGSEIVWSAETINGLFDEGPDHYIPGTKMPMQRIAQQKDRDDLIAYLRVATAGE
jgi:cytochrome c